MTPSGVAVVGLPAPRAAAGTTLTGDYSLVNALLAPRCG